ncbi:MAG: DUF805 domain-containing protein [Verrucomicrobiales bacterium]|nr:DUF805 domain-containing protein [Verrucomicrobiales bacterium]
MNWYLSVLRNFSNFSGRARRKEYWMFALINTLISILLLVADYFVGTYSIKLGMGLLNGLYTLAVIVPAIAVSVRRLHDTGRSGWWILICLVPCIGPIVLLVFAVMEGNPGPNAYGPSPK